MDLVFESKTSVNNFPKRFGNFFSNKKRIRGNSASHILDNIGIIQGKKFPF